MTEATLRLPSRAGDCASSASARPTNTPTILRRYQSLATASVNGSQSSAAAAAAAAIAASSRRVPVIAASARGHAQRVRPGGAERDPGAVTVLAVDRRVAPRP